MLSSQTLRRPLRFSRVYLQFPSPLLNNNCNLWNEFGHQLWGQHDSNIEIGRSSSGHFVSDDDSEGRGRSVLRMLGGLWHVYTSCQHSTLSLIGHDLINKHCHAVTRALINTNIVDTIPGARDRKYLCWRLEPVFVSIVNCLKFFLMSSIDAKSVLH